MSKEWESTAKELVRECQMYGLTLSLKNIGEPLILTLPNGTELELILRFSRFSTKSGYSIFIRNRHFGTNDNVRYYVFALIDPKPTRYIIIRHDLFKRLMDVPLKSKTFQTTGEYAFNFGRYGPNKLGKWARFIYDPSVFLAINHLN